MATMNIRFFSQVLTRSVSFTAYLPTDRPSFLEEEEKKPFPTLYLLHGMVGDEHTWESVGALYELSYRYRLAIILPTGENSFYCDSALTNRNFGSFISEELVEFTRNTLPLSRKREETFIGGMSMGGFGAFVNGLRHPQTFGAITAFSAALIKQLILRADDEPGLDYFTRIQYQSMFGLEKIEDFEGSDCDYEALARRLAASDLQKPRIYMDCGTEDVSLYKANSAFCKLLKDLGYEVNWDSRPGGHDTIFWNDSLRKAAQWLPIELLTMKPDSPYMQKEKIRTDAMTRKMTM